MYVFIYIYIFIYTHTYTCTYTHMYMHIYELRGEGGVAVRAGAPHALPQHVGVVLRQVEGGDDLQSHTMKYCDMI